MGPTKTPRANRCSNIHWTALVPTPALFFRDMGYLTEIAPLSCHLTYAKAEPVPPESAPTMDGEKPPLFEQVELKLDEPASKNIES